MNRRYSYEDDRRIRAVYELPPRSPELVRAIEDLAAALNRSPAAIYSRYSYITRDEEPRTLLRVTRKFTRVEDDYLLAMKHRPSNEEWQVMSVQLNRPISTMRHRRKYLLQRERLNASARKRPDLDARFRFDIPVAQPAWFENRITRDRLMAGR